MSGKERFKAVPAGYIVFRRGQKVLLLLRKNTGYYDGCWSMPSGHVEQGESLKAAALREALEETGIRLKRDSLELVHIMNRPARESADTRLDFFFETKDWQGEIVNMEPEKCAALKWYDINRLPKETVPEVGHALECIAKGVVESEYGWGSKP